MIFSGFSYVIFNDKAKKGRKRIQMMKVRGVLFDLYGTLVRLPVGKKDPMISLIDELKGKKEEPCLRTGFDSKTIRRIAMTERFETLGEFVTRITVDEFKLKELDRYEEELTKQIGEITVFPETIEVLRKLKERGLKLGIVSNLAYRYGEVITNLELGEFFDSIVLSYEVGAIKPEPQIYERALERLKLQSNEVFMTGDKNINDVIGPRQIGIRAKLLDREKVGGDEEKMASLMELLDLI